MNVLEIRKLTKKIGSAVILKNVRLIVEEKENVLIKGRSGAGKTTLFNIIGCLEKPTHGCVSVLGRDISALSSNEMSRLRLGEIGFIFQDFNLLPHLTAYENIELVMELAGRTKTKSAITKLLRDVKLGRKKNMLPVHMSGGEIRRLTIARALANKPKLVLADEPTSNLDEKNAKNIFRLLLSLNRKYGTSVIVVSHDPVAEKYFEKKYLLKNHALKRMK